ncbi:MAG: hypothetical protein IPK58_13145 [Acidobacteria bacterium]|nr:hypothetical protein [Acidobacteriota bacterium]
MMAESLSKKGVYVIPFSFPVVPKQSADPDAGLKPAARWKTWKFAVEKFAEAKAEVRI